MRKHDHVPLRPSGKVADDRCFNVNARFQFLSFRLFPCWLYSQPKQPVLIPRSFTDCELFGRRSKTESELLPPRFLGTRPLSFSSYFTHDPVTVQPGKTLPGFASRNHRQGIRARLSAASRVMRYCSSLFPFQYQLSQLWSTRGLRPRALGSLDAKRSFPAGGRYSGIQARGRLDQMEHPGKSRRRDTSAGNPNTSVPL